MDWVRLRKWVGYASVSLGVASVAFWLFRTAKGRTAPEITAEVVLSTAGDEATGAPETPLTPADVIAIVRELTENFPNYLRTLRQTFRTSRRAVLATDDTTAYVEHCRNFLLQYMEYSNQITSNCEQVVAAHNMTVEQFYEHLNRLDADAQVQAALENIYYEKEFDIHTTLPETLTELVFTDIMRYKLDGLKRTQKGRSTLDYCVSEVSIADQTFSEFGYEEEEIMVAGIRYNSPEITGLRNAIAAETARLIRLDFIPDFSFA